ncbi:MAG: hypothetical protein ACFE96_08710 [Candidatus Hermodarchaeota archaeon]
MNFINECFRQHSCWKFHALQESSWEWVTLTICYEDDRWTVSSSPNWDKSELISLYWASDLLRSPSESELSEWLMQQHKNQRVKGLAPDTNLIIPGFMTNYLKRLAESPHDIIPVLVLIARSINFELHSMAPFKYGKVLSEEAEINLLDSLNKWPPIREVWNLRSQNLIGQIRSLNDGRGRMGMKGNYEVDLLHSWAPVILVKPPHIYHSPKVLEDTPFLNAIHDSLIRYEIDFLRQNTSLPTLFLSNDRDQCKSATQEGLEVLHIQRPQYTSDINTIASSYLNTERIKQLILGLLVLSPCLRLTSSIGAYFLSWTWLGRSMDDVDQHRVRIIDFQGESLFVKP